MNTLIQKEIEGVEYFTVADTGESGMSISGLARWVGKSQNNLTTLFKKLESDPIHSNVHKYLQPLCGKALTLSIRDSQGRKIVKDDVCSFIALYYAYEARITTEEAKLAVKAFTAIGIRTYIQSITGYQKPVPVQLSRLELIHLALAAEEERLRLEEENKVLQPKATVYDAIVEAGQATNKEWYTVKEVAKMLSVMVPGRDTPLGQNLFMELLRTLKIIQKNNTLPYQYYENQGDKFRVAIKTVAGGNAYPSTQISMEGINYLAQKIAAKGYSFKHQ